MGAHAGHDDPSEPSLVANASFKPKRTGSVSYFEIKNQENIFFYLIITGTTPDRRQSKTLYILTNIDQNSLKHSFQLPFVARLAQSKT